MRSLKSYLGSTGFSVNGSVSAKIILFDVDNTLIHTTAKIGVRRNGKLMKHLTDQEYNDYILKAGETFDFSEFADPDILNNEALTPYWNTLKREYRKGTHIGILTARGDCDLIRNFLIKKGIDIKKSLIFATDDPRLGLSGRVQDRKAEVITRLYNLGYRTFVFFDDNDNNLRSVKKMEDIYDDINIILKKV